VDNDSSPGSSGKLIVLANWWIFVVISLPLTIATLYTWWFFTSIQATGRYPSWWVRIARRKLSVRPNQTPIPDEENSVDPVSTPTTMDAATEKPS
jgi:hypothetical protein